MKIKSKYRLRWNNRVVGYAERSKNGMLFKGKELLWWMRGNYPKYNQVDEFVGIFDSMKREIYELDMVSYKINNNDFKRTGVIIWENLQESFGVYDVHSKHFTNLFVDEFCLFESDKLEVISHLFNHPKLGKELGLEELI